MFRIFTLAIGDLADPRIITILLRSLIVTLLIFAGLGLGIAWLLDGTDPCGWIGAVESCSFGLSTSGLGALVLTALAIWLLFPAIALGVISGYSDRIVAVVEARHYPAALATARPIGLAGGAWLGLRSSARLILYNLVALPIYLLLLLTGVGTLIAFLLVNGLAVGRDFGEMVATRHTDRTARLAWLKATRGDRALIGIAVAAIFLVPVANLLAPVIGAAMTAHLFHRRRQD
ncbi:EI24 domain-containing protein [Sphingomonas sp. MMS24-J13]|uniref:EI24 domain-containing protein n=1 Tax=Sphingomonas sp. MMS24-J13 TaxID=3238686 RepID=UPI00384E8279